MEVKNRVKHYRVAKQITQEKLACMTGVTRQTIGLIEKERYNPTIALCLQLCEALDVSLVELFRAAADNEGEENDR